MTWLQVVVLAIVQGITEFLPISSSGHLVLVPSAAGWADQGLAFDVAGNGYWAHEGIDEGDELLGAGQEVGLARDAQAARSRSGHPAMIPGPKSTMRTVAISPARCALEKDSTPTVARITYMSIPVSTAFATSGPKPMIGVIRSPESP